jgi:hypothetical protein
VARLRRLTAHILVIVNLIPLPIIVKQGRQPGVATAVRSLKVISSSTAVAEWSWDHELIRLSNAADLQIICLAVCVALGSNITAMIQDSDAVLLLEGMLDIPYGKFRLKSFGGFK